MKSSPQATPRKRAVVISSLAAKVLGHTRVAEGSISAERLNISFPAFNTQELTNAIAELLEKDLFKQKGYDDRATYSLTDYGRDGRVGIS